MDAAFELLKDGHGLLRELPDVWVWVDATPEQRLQSVVKVCGDAVILMPWQSDDEAPLLLKR